MSKLMKAIKNPKGFLVDAHKNSRSVRDLHRRVEKARASGRRVAVLVGFSTWKSWMCDFLPDREVVFLGHSPRVPTHLLRQIPMLGDVEVFAWSYKYPKELEDICARARISLTLVEDGFIRSFGLGASKTAPLSLVFDKRAMHFDREVGSDLEELLETHDFARDSGLMSRAHIMMRELRSRGVSKYNGLGRDVTLRANLGIAEDQECILVIGQVEDDLSLAYGMKEAMTGNDLVLRAAMENPDAVILYRPHPESRAVSKPHYSNPDDVAHFAYVVPEDVSLHACFRAATKVYAMTSLAGFEALLFGLPVKVFGCPFYAGWGVTEDVDPAAQRRTRTLSVAEIFAAAYILYPRYWDPVTRTRIEPEDALQAMTVIGTHAARLASIAYPFGQATQLRPGECAP